MASLSSQLSRFSDCHSHILPGVDDGVKTMEVALQVLQRYEQYGIAEVWCTPHVMEDIPNTTEQLKARFAELQDAYHGPVRLHLAAEYMMDELFEERLATFLGFVGHVIEHCSIACKLLDTCLAVKFGVQPNFYHSKSQWRKLHHLLCP